MDLPEWTLLVNDERSDIDEFAPMHVGVYARGDGLEMKALEEESVKRRSEVVTLESDILIGFVGFL